MNGCARFKPRGHADQKGLDTLSITVTTRSQKMMNPALVLAVVEGR
jgi:hypothetical protein